MLSRRAKPSSLVWCPEPLFGSKTADLYVGCLLALIGRAKPAGATFSGIKGRNAFQSWLATGEGVETFAIGPGGAGLIQRTRIVEPSERRAPALAEEKP